MKTATLTIKHVPVGLVESLRARARRNHRSLQGELLTLLEQTVGTEAAFEAALERIKRRGLKTPSDSVEIIREARDGRPPRR